MKVFLFLLHNADAFKETWNLQKSKKKNIKFTGIINPVIPDVFYAVCLKHPYQGQEAETTSQFKKEQKQNISFITVKL